MHVYVHMYVPVGETLEKAMQSTLKYSLRALHFFTKRIISPLNKFAINALLICTAFFDLLVNFWQLIFILCLIYNDVATGFLEPVLLMKSYAHDIHSIFAVPNVL